MTIHFIHNDKGTPGKLADAELHFSGGPLDGLKLVGISVWERKTGGRNVTFPARQYSLNGERRSWALLRPVSDTAAQGPLRDLILEAFAEEMAQREPQASGMTLETLEAELAHCTGTENHYQHLTGMRFTDGIKHMADLAGAYWLIDLVGSYQPTLTRFPFQVWTLTVEESDGARSARVEAREDTNAPLLVTQDIPLTDFPVGTFKLYLSEGVLLLPSEY